MLYTLNYRKNFFFVFIFLLIVSCTSIHKKREIYLKEHPELTDHQKEAILNGNIISGMSMDMVTASWGKPENIINEVIKDRNIERWFYKKERGDYINRYVVSFHQGLVIRVKFKGHNKLPVRKKKTQRSRQYLH